MSHEMYQSINTNLERNKFPLINVKCANLVKQLALTGHTSLFA